MTYTSNRLKQFTPLRYPGGKAKLTPFIKALIVENDIEDGCYVEPFAGGAGIAIQLLMQGYVSEIAINDVSLPIYAFWKSVLDENERFAERVLSVPLNVEEWDLQKAILKDCDPANLFDLGFATFYLNRTNRSGVLSGGIIGGRNQTGEWLIDARFNRENLAYRVARIGNLSKQISLTCNDAIDFLQKIADSRSSDRTLVYADPPYFEKGRQLYLDFYSPDDHAILANFIIKRLSKFHWLVSYDDAPEIRRIYGDQRITPYNIPYSLRSSRLGSEVMFYSPRLVIPGDSQSGEEIGPADRFADT